MRLLILFGFLLPVFCSLEAFGNPSEPNLKSPSWESPPKSTVTFEIGIQTISLDLSTFPEADSGADILYKPNSPTRTHFGIGYDNLGLSINMANPVDKERENYYGKSTVNDYRLSFFGNHHTYGLYYQNYSGYYAEDSNKFNPQITDAQPRIQRSDLTSKSYGFEYIYNFLPDEFSLEAAFGHSAQQIRSGYSYVGILNIIHNEISADRPVISGATTVSKYGDWQHFKGGHFLSINPGIGAGGTFAYYRYYATGLATLVYGPQRQKFSLDDKDFDRWVGNMGANVKIGIGYNGKKYFSGFQVEAITTTIAINNVGLSSTQAQGLLFVGSRFFDIPIPVLDSFSQWISKSDK